MNVPIAENWLQFVRDEVQSGLFPSEAAVFEEALALLRGSDRGQEPRQAVADYKPIDEIMSGVPDEVFDRPPVDGSVQHDHYIYGTPR